MNTFPVYLHFIVVVPCCCWEEEDEEKEEAEKIEFKKKTEKEEIINSKTAVAGVALRKWHAVDDERCWKLCGNLAVTRSSKRKKVGGGRGGLTFSLATLSIDKRQSSVTDQNKRESNGKEGENGPSHQTASDEHQNGRLI